MPSLQQLSKHELHLALHPWPVGLMCSYPVLNLNISCCWLRLSILIKVWGKWCTCHWIDLNEWRAFHIKHLPLAGELLGAQPRAVNHGLSGWLHWKLLARGRQALPELPEQQHPQDIDVHFNAL